MPEIILSAEEVEHATGQAVIRMNEMLDNGRGNSNNAPRHNIFERNREGCMGELALAKFLGLEWVGSGKVGDKDVGDYEVRTAGGLGYRLILHPEDNDDSVFWLVCGEKGTYTVKGWILAREGKKDVYWTDPKERRPAYFVPQSALHDPEDQGYLVFKGLSSLGRE